MKNNSTKLVFLSCGDVLYENGYKTRVFGEMKLASGLENYEKYFVSFEKPESYRKNSSQIEIVKEELIKINFKTVIFPRQNKWKIDSIFDVWKLTKFMKKINFEEGIIHAQSIYAAYMALLARGNNHKIKIIFDAHGLVGPELKHQKVFWPMRWVTQWVEKQCITKSDAIITASNSLAKYFDTNYPNLDLTVLPCLCDADLFRNVNFTNISARRSELNLPTDKKIAVYLGGMQTWQNFYMIKSFAKQNDLFLLIITDNQQQAMAIFADFREKLIVSLPHREVGKYLQLADMGLLFRDKNELNRIAFPTKMAEYLLCGLPVIHNGTVSDIKSVIDDNQLGVNVDEWGMDISKYEFNVKKKNKCRDYVLKNLTWETKKDDLQKLYQKITKPKILYLLTSGFYGGAQKYNLQLAKHFQENGYQTKVVFSEEGDTTMFENKLRSDNVKFEKLNWLKRAINPLLDPWAFGEIIQILSRYKPDVLHISSSRAGVLGRLAGKLMGVEKIFYTAHGWVFNEDIWWGKKNFYLFLERLMALFCDRIFCVSQYDLDTAVGYGFDEKKLALIYNGIQIQKLNKLSKYQTHQTSKSDPCCHPRGESGALLGRGNVIKPVQTCPTLSKHIQKWKKENKKIIGTVANFFPPKNLGLFVEVAEKLITGSPIPHPSIRRTGSLDRLSERPPNRRTSDLRMTGKKFYSNNSIINHDKFRFIIVGDGPLKNGIENLINKHRLSDYFYLTGQVDDVAELVKNFDICLLTSSKEGFPYALLEVGLLKVPIVAGRVGGVGELIIDGETGYLTPELTADCFIEKIEKLLADNNKKIADSLYEKIVIEFDLEKMMDSYRDEYFY